jgi:hypothetical protein
MSVNFQPQEFQRAGRLAFKAPAAPGLGDSTSQQAKTKLHAIALDLVSSTGSIKSGYLKLVNDGEGGLRMGARLSMSPDNSTRDATNMVKSLVQEAYGDNAVVVDSLNRYLEHTDQRIGTQSFVKLVQSLEVHAPAEGVPDRLSLAQVKANARLEFMPSVDVGDSVKLKQQLQRAATGATDVTPAERDAWVGRLADPEKQQLLTYFDSKKMDQDLAALASHASQFPPSGAGAALQELRACEATLRRAMVASGDAPEVQADVLAALPDAVVDPVLEKFENLLLAQAEGQQGGAPELLDLCRELTQQLNLHIASQNLKKGGDEVAQLRRQMLMSLMARLTDAQAGALWQNLREASVIDGLYMTMDVLNSAGNLGFAGQHNALASDFDSASNAATPLAETVGLLDEALSLRLRGHAGFGAPATRTNPLSKPMLEMTPQARAGYWRLNSQQPVVALADIFATRTTHDQLSRRKDVAGLSAWRAPAYRTLTAQEALGRLPGLNGSDRARMAQLFMHPGSLDSKFSDKFIYLLGTAAPELLAAARTQGEVLSDAQIWEAVLGLPVPPDIQGNGSLALGERMVNHALARYNEVSLSQHLAQGGQHDDFESKSMNLWMGLINGIPLARQLELFQQPFGQLSEQDFFSVNLKLAIDKASVDTVFGQTEDIHRWAPPTTFRFEGPGLDDGFTQLDPNQHPGLAARRADVNPTLDDPVIQDLNAKVNALTDARQLQSRAVLAALTQASTMVFRTLVGIDIPKFTQPFAPELGPDPIQGGIEHGAYDFRVVAQPEGAVSIRVVPNAPMPFVGELHLLVSPDGTIETQGFKLAPRVGLLQNQDALMAQLDALTSRLNDPSEPDLPDAMAQAQVFVHQLEAGLSQLALEPEPNAPALHQVSAQVKEQLAVLQFDLANVLVDRNRVGPDPMAPWCEPNVEELAQAGVLLEAVMGHAKDADNAELLAMAEDLYKSDIVGQDVEPTLVYDSQALESFADEIDAYRQGDGSESVGSQV